MILEDILEDEENTDVEPVEGEDTEYSEIFLPGRVVAETPRGKKCVKKRMNHRLQNLPILYIIKTGLGWK